MSDKKILITGTAGFIGFHVAQNYLSKGWQVIGIDGITNYYDVKLKNHRHTILSGNKNFIKYEFLLDNQKKIFNIFKKYNPKYVIHLAAQPGVRYSLENPSSYINSNIISTFNILEVCKKFKLKHLMISSTSSVYGDNKVKPFKETHKTDSPLSIYAATKKSCEVLSHSYSHIYEIPITLFRFFTVYGPWGRPDMAIFKFTNAIINNKIIEVYNRGNLDRDFTYIDDLVDGIVKLTKVIPTSKNSQIEEDCLSDFAPYRIVNIGNEKPLNIKTYVEVIEKIIGKKAKKKFVKKQIGDVLSTWSDTSLLTNLTQFKPKVSIEDGVTKFVKWYIDYYNINI